MEPNEALGIAAQVAATLGGFAGVVVVFRPQSIHQWSPVDRARLHLLLHNSICPLAYALFAMLLLSVNPPPPNIWRWSSLFALLFQIPGAIVAARHSRAMGKEAFQDSGSRLLFYLTASVGAGALLMQFVNIAVLNVFWPFFLPIVVHLLAGMLQFMRMVLLLPEKE
jgi:hypothetical protein